MVKTRKSVVYARDKFLKARWLMVGSHWLHTLLGSRPLDDLSHRALLPTLINDTISFDIALVLVTILSWWYNRVL